MSFLLHCFFWFICSKLGKNCTFLWQHFADKNEHTRCRMQKATRSIQLSFPLMQFLQYLFQVHVNAFHSQNKEVNIQIIKIIGKWCTMNRTALLKLWYICKYSLPVSYKQTLLQVHILSIYVCRYKDINAWPAGHQDIVFGILKVVTNQKHPWKEHSWIPNRHSSTEFCSSDSKDREIWELWPY